MIMLGHLVLFLFFLAETVSCQRNTQDLTIIDFVVGSLSPYVEKSNLPKCGDQLGIPCFQIEALNNEFDKFDFNNDGSLDKDDFIRLFEKNIEVLIDTFDFNNDGKIELSLEQNFFNIKVTFFKPIIQEYFSHFEIKPSDVAPSLGPGWTETDLKSWTNLLKKYSESLTRPEHKILKDLIDGPFGKLVSVLDQNGDGNFNKQEVLDFTVAVLKMLDEDNDGKVTLDEIIIYAKETKIFSNSKLDDAKTTIKRTVKSLNDKKFTPLMAQLDTNNDNKISKAEAKNILKWKFQRFAPYRQPNVNFDDFHDEFINPMEFLANEGQNFPQSAIDWVKVSVEDLKQIVENKDIPGRGCNGRNGDIYIVSCIILLVISII